MEKVGGDERVFTFITINFRLNLIIEISLLGEESTIKVDVSSMTSQTRLDRDKVRIEIETRIEI